MPHTIVVITLSVQPTVMKTDAGLSGVPADAWDRRFFLAKAQPYEHLPGASVGCS
jgi:hypothetical protein